MICENILEQAKELVVGDRQEDYGDKLTNHENIAALWSIFLRKKLTAHDVAMCMALVKVARLMHAHKTDSYIENYLSETVLAVKAKEVVPIHWEPFTQPASNHTLPVLIDDINGSLKRVKKILDKHEINMELMRISQ